MVNCSLHSIVKAHQGGVLEICLCSLAAVVMVCSGQRNSHGGEGGTYGHKWPQNKTDDGQQPSNGVDEPIWQLGSWGRVVESFEDARDEVPEGKRAVVCYVICLHKGGGQWPQARMRGALWEMDVWCCHSPCSLNWECSTLRG